MTRRRGVTVVEALVAIAIGCIVLGMLWQLIGGMTRADAQLDRLVTRAMAMAQLSRQLARDVERACPPEIAGEAPLRPEASGFDVLVVHPVGAAGDAFADVRRERVSWRYDAARRRLVRNGVAVGPADLAGVTFAATPEGVLQLTLAGAGRPAVVAVPLSAALRGLAGWIVHPGHIRLVLGSSEA
jgi:hypothetical protein